MNRWWQTLSLALLIAVAAGAAPPNTCAGKTEYEKGLCAYQRRQFAEAERIFRLLVAAGSEKPQTVRAMYFLARTEMKRGRYEDASVLLVRIYTIDRAFYGSWNCDFLLGECRKALGKG